MPFCTKCGASVAGAFCSTCGTPAAASAATAAAVPPGMPQPVGMTAERRTSPIVWVLIAVLAIFVIGGLGVAMMARSVLHHAREAGVAFDRTRDGGFAVSARGADGRDARVEFGTSVGKLPSWVPDYPGSSGHATFSVRGSGDGEGEGGNFTFTTEDSPTRVLDFYSDKCKAQGMNVSLTLSTPEVGKIVARDDDSDRRNLVVIATGGSSKTAVNVTYAAKRN